MKKFCFLGLIIILSFGVSACMDNNKDNQKKEPISSNTAISSTSKVREISLVLDNPEVLASKDGEAIITGKTTPKANVTIGFGVIGDSTTAANNGTFTLKYKLDEAKEKELDINASLESATAQAHVTVKPNQEMLIQETKNKDITQLSSEPTADQRLILQDLANQQFEKMFPYKGSKIKSSLGVIRDWTTVDNHWFYKAEAKIVNAFGVEQDTVVEITIVPTGPDTGNVDILNY